MRREAPSDPSANNKSLVSRLKTDLATGRAGIGEQSTFWFTKVNDLLIRTGDSGQEWIHPCS